MGSEAATEDGYDARLVQMGPKCAPHHYRKLPWINQLLIQNKMDLCFFCYLHLILTLTYEWCSRNTDSSDQIIFFQYSVLQFCWTHANCSLGFLCCAFKDALLQTFVVTSCYMSSCCLPISLSVWLFSSDLWYQQVIFTLRTDTQPITIQQSLQSHSWTWLITTEGLVVMTCSWLNLNTGLG